MIHHRDSFHISDREIGADAPCFIIAEAGVNHNGSLALAHELVDIAADAGADAIKFQTFTTERLATASAEQADYQRTNTGKEESQFDMLKRLELSREDHVALMEHCERQSILFLSTPFDEQSADLLASLGVPAFKTPSGELTNLNYLSYISTLGKPMIVSTGMATLGEVEQAVTAIQAAGDPPLAILHCVSDYPASPIDVNLRAIRTLADNFLVPVGYSDHTLGMAVTFAAVALGAKVIEKHFTTDRHLEGPDHRASLEPSELRNLVHGIREVEQSLGDGRKRPATSEFATRIVARKSVTTTRELRPGAVITADDLTLKRPGDGIEPLHRHMLIGRTLRNAVAADTTLQWEMFI